MTKPWIKICGVTRTEDTDAAVRSGADALGANFYPPSPRFLTQARLAEVFAQVPGCVKRVALFVNPTRAEVESILASGYIDWLQFHGDETSIFCESFGYPYIKALRVGEYENLAQRADEFNEAELVLLDAFDKKAPGGTGKVFDWKAIETLSDSVREKLLLAGGLTPENIGSAVAEVNPFGVDVSSGVERSPGIKDHAKIKAFIEGAMNGNNRN